GAAAGAGRARAAEALVAAHARPVPRLEEGALARLAGATAMIDVSDGLALDLSRLAAASGVGAALDAVPVWPGATEEEALGGGEDYELLFAVPDAARALSAFEDAGACRPAVIGRCTKSRGELTLRGGVLPATGYRHRF
ncbi:MAG: AIR synthase-related protein, partial [Acidimicrobiales bacterium]